MNKTSSLRKGWTLAATLPLLWLTPARAQTADGTQIIGYLNSSAAADQTDLANSRFTTFIDGFITPDPNGSAANPSLLYDAPSYYANTSQLSPAFVDSINTVEAAGKNVLLSFGGADATPAEYAQYADTPAATQTLANILTAYVTNAPSYVNAVTGQTVAITTATMGSSTGAFKGFSGIDLDYEDTNALTGASTYGTNKVSGVTFITNLTNDLAANFKQTGKNLILTQAPQTPYLRTAYTAGYSLAAYQAVVTARPGGELTLAGTNTTWLNVQFYSNPAYDGGSPGTVDGVIQAFEALVQDNPGIPTSKLVLTLPMYSGIVANNNFSDLQITQIVQGINAYLLQHGDGTIAGVAGFQLYDPAFYNAGDQAGQDAYNMAFADAVFYAVPEPSTWALLGLGSVSAGIVVLRRRTAR